MTSQKSLAAPGDYPTEATPLFQQVKTQEQSHELRERYNDAFPSILTGKKVILGTESLGPVNGVSRTTGQLVDYLRNHGVHVAIVAPETKAKRSKTKSADPEVRLHGYPLPYNPDLTVVYPFRFDRICRRTFSDPDIVYLASPASVGFQFLLQIRQLRHAPIVLCNFQTDLSAYSEIMFPSLMRRFAVWLLGVVQGYLFSHRTVYTVFYPSSGIRDYLEKAGTPSNKLVHLGRGVDTDMFNASQRDEAYRKELAPNGEKILVTVCRIAPEKGFEFLAHAAMKLADRGFPFKLLVVGGNRNLAVEESVRRLFDPIKDRVIFTGFLTGVALARAYASGDLFLHCSITETFGLVVLEAMASGLPVIARDQGGPSEIVRDGKTGYLVAPNDLDVFVSLTEQLSLDTSLYSAFSKTARLVAEDTTWEKINMRVSWHLADGLEKHMEKTRVRKQRPIRSWIISRYYDLKDGTVLPVMITLRLILAVGVVLAMWVIAVIPLIVHGNSVFQSGWRTLDSITLLFHRI